MLFNDYLTVAAFQGKIVERNSISALDKILKILKYAEDRQVDILCLPETYLHGYFELEKDAMQHSINLQSQEFLNILNLFKNFKTTLILGLNEIENGILYNTAVVIEQGKLLGRYRKAYHYAPYDYYKDSNEFPVFEKRGVKFGVVICIDITLLEPSRILALNGAQIIFCPMYNRVSTNHKMLCSISNKSPFIARSSENACWLVASDIIWSDDSEQICPGYAGIYNRDGFPVVSSEPFVENMLIYSIPLSTFKEIKYKRLLGKPELREMMERDCTRVRKEFELKS